MTSELSEKTLIAISALIFNFQLSIFHSKKGNGPGEPKPFFVNLKNTLIHLIVTATFGLFFL